MVKLPERQTLRTMYTETEGIILRQVKALGGRRMIVLFSQKHGKISAGTSINEKGKNKSALALRPFTYGKYELFQGRDSYSISGAETIRSFFDIGADIDKYMAGSQVLELTDKMLEEEQPSPEIFRLLLDCLCITEKRNSDFATPAAAYKIKLLALSGAAIETNCCSICGSKDSLDFFSVPSGGTVCRSCAEKGGSEALRTFEMPAADLNALRYIASHRISDLSQLSLSEDIERRISKMLKAYYAHHFGIERLKSDELRISI